MQFDKAYIIQKMLEIGLINKQMLMRIGITCKNRNIDLLKVLINYTGMNTDQVQEFAREHLGLPRIDLEDVILNPEVVKSVPIEFEIAHKVVPAFKIVGHTHLAVSNPFDFKAMELVQDYIGKEFYIVLAPETQVIQAVNSLQSA